LVRQADLADHRELEVDLIARYVERMVSADTGQPHND
jgi:riboflavin synthase alpha subunit